MTPSNEINLQEIHSIYLMTGAMHVLAVQVSMLTPKEYGTMAWNVIATQPMLRT